MSNRDPQSPRALLTAYYAATAVFLALDAGLDINVRIAFLDAWPVWRGAWYGCCFGCLAGMMLRPRWAPLLGGVESLLTVGALILGMGVRVMVPDEAALEAGRVPVRPAEIVNFAISGAAAYVAWTQALRQLHSAR